MSTKQRLTVWGLSIAVFISYIFAVPKTVAAASSLHVEGTVSSRSSSQAPPRIEIRIFDTAAALKPVWSEQYGSPTGCDVISPDQSGSFVIHAGSCKELTPQLLSPDHWIQLRFSAGGFSDETEKMRLTPSANNGAQTTVHKTSTQFSLQDALASGLLSLKSSPPKTSLPPLSYIVGTNIPSSQLSAVTSLPYTGDMGTIHVQGVIVISATPMFDTTSKFIIHSLSELPTQLTSGSTNMSLLKETTTQLSEPVIKGTQNQVTVEKSGSIYTLSLPQNIHTGANLNIAGLKIAALGGILKAADGTVSGSAGIADLAGVEISSASNGQLLRYNGSAEQWENWTPNTLTLSGLSATSPLTYSSSTGIFGLSYDTTNLTVNGSSKLTTIQNIGTSSNPTFAGLSSTGRILLTTSGDSGSLSSSGGAMHIDLTNDIGSGIGIYSNAGASAQGNMINVKVDNAAYAQAAFYMNYDGSSNAVEIVSNSTDTSSNALAVTGNNPNDSTLGIIGYETGRGTIKVTHNGTGSDTNASGLSIDLAGTGTKAQGLYVDSTASGGTTGNLLRLRNQTVDQFVVNYQGNLTMAGNLVMGSNGTDTTITKNGNTVGDEFFVGTTGAFRVQRSATNSEAFRVQINGDTQGRWLGTSDGKLKWGDGSSAQDTILQRGAAGVLWLDGGLVINNSNGSLNTTIKGVNDSNLFFANASGNTIGIGTSTQGSKLDIADSGTGVVHGLRIQNTVAAANNSAADILFAAKRTTSGTTNVASISGMITDVTQSAYKGALLFSTANNAGPAERMRIDNTGNVGINTNNPQFLLQVKIDGSNEGHVTSTGAWANTSDLRLKKNIADLNDGLDKVLALRPVTYDTLTAPDSALPGLHVGFIAQEVEKIVPQLVDTDGNGMKSLIYGQFAPLLVSAIQQQQTSLNETASKLSTLEQTDKTDYSTRLATIEKDITDIRALLSSVPQTSTQSITDATLKNLIIQNSLVVQGSAVFKSPVTFEGGATLNRPIFDSTFAGYAKIKKGAKFVRVTFDTPYQNSPVINVTAHTGGYLYELIDESEKGFTILLSQPADTDVLFSWISIAINNAKTYESEETETQPTPSITITQTPAASPSAIPASESPL